jgi:hypothetical protein
MVNQTNSAGPHASVAAGRKGFKDDLRERMRRLGLGHDEIARADFDAEGERELASLQADFPAYEIWREETGYGTQYVARGRTLGVHPHTVVTADLGRLRDVLAGATPPRRGNDDAAMPGLSR